MRNAFTAAAALAAIWTMSACGGSSTPSDAGTRVDGGRDGGATGGQPQVTVTASPPTGNVGETVSFTAAITGGTPPYRACTWHYTAGGADSAGTITGSSCTGSHAYATEGDFSV